jgi:nucleoside-diphosphate-sugar epimerase
MRVLILGGMQFVGRHIVGALLPAGHMVSILARGKSPDELPAQVERFAVTAMKGHWDWKPKRAVPATCAWT